MDTYNNGNTSNSENKVIQLPDTSGSPDVPSSKSKNKCKNVDTIKEKMKRVITKTDVWQFTPDDLKFENQFLHLSSITSQETPVCQTNHPIDSNTAKIFKKTVLQQINKKIAGYRAQDIGKGLFLKDKIIDLSGVLQRLMSCNLECFYCHKHTMLLYENVREPLQWTLERIDNKYGHNSDNVEIACLNCNLRRRTMYFERFLFTKNLTIVKTE